MTSAPAKKQKIVKALDNAEEEPENEWEPPSEWTSWENEVDEIMNVERNNSKMWVYIRWNNSHETSHDIEAAHRYCPLKLIAFYESHLKFTQA